jgi:hypothetical protein
VEKSRNPQTRSAYANVATVELGWARLEWVHPTYVLNYDAFGFQFGELRRDLWGNVVAFNALEKFLSLFRGDLAIFRDDYGRDEALGEELPEHFATIRVLLKEKISKSRLSSWHFQ